ncbi:MAG: FIG00460628: hypothetical protein [uncultured Paraburkholderia sp.]|nr:MAG: FIG00460628: hypothetical protein [uncultured Paraburkholderia sp.]CAH2799405.1 MAG: FIG00460628: hypothetical protein [uncultured Paraburkholderia sp.]CAH2934229.1 MAG: FIG00460628: hypothetical protein [uncultured Paraburkholderia sp.]
MRLTIHLDTFDRVHPMAFAILWLDMDTRQWSREGHLGLELPEWGTLQMDCANTVVSAPEDCAPVCVLEGLDLNDCSRRFEGETGRAQSTRRGCPVALLVARRCRVEQQHERRDADHHGGESVSHESALVEQQPVDCHGQTGKRRKHGATATTIRYSARTMTFSRPLARQLHRQALRRA